MCLAVPGQVEEISGNDPLTRIAKVNFSGVIKEINVVYVPEVKLGNWVIVHAGFALNILDEKEAEKLLTDLKTIESLNQEI